MPRSLWNGTITFGAVAVPVKLHSAVDNQTVRFHEVHLRDGARIEHRRFCSKEDREVPREEVVKGAEVSRGRWVVVDQDEIDAAAGSRAHVVDVEHFVDAAAIDPVFYDRAYFLGAGDGGADAYRLLHDALERTGRAAIGRFTFHNREYLAAIRPYDGVLALHTMRFADELVPAGDLDVPGTRHAPEDREVEMAGRLVASLHERFRPERLHDEYREAVLGAIERKARGEEIEAPAQPEAEEHDDLLAALQASLDDHGGGTRRKKARA
ncbi:MAG TPA: Ku protein [Baekduia sp.]|nr:Ku protein [Baekduia sp.]